MIKIVQELINLFENAPRIGVEKDEPEGSKYIMISDTLAKEFIKELKKAL